MASCGDNPDSEDGLDPFIGFLVELSEDIPNSDLRIMKDLCVKTIPEGELEEITAPFDLFLSLIHRDLLCDSKTSILEELLHKARRLDLEEKVKNSSFVTGSKRETKVRGIPWLAHYLKHLYTTHYIKFKPMPWNEDISHHVDKMYTPPKVEKIDERGNHQEVDINEMFACSVRGNRAKGIKIIGEPAIGKSTFCRKVTYDWACGKMHQFKLLFLLELRHVNKDSLLDTIFELLLPDHANITKDELWRFLLHNQDSVLFVLDGLDEMDTKYRESSEVSRLLNKIQLLPMCTVAVTSRPHECDSQLRYCDAHYRIQGFTNAACMQYMDRYFKDDKEALRSLKSVLHSQYPVNFNSEYFPNTTIFGKPFYLSLICILWKDHQLGADFPSSETELHSEVLDCILKKYCTRTNQSLDDGEVPQSLKDVVTRELGLHAFKLLEKNEVSILEKCVKPDWLVSVGILVKDRGISRIRPRKLCNFYHKTWLEYFAALHIAGRIRDGADVSEFQFLFDDFHKHYTVLLYLVGTLRSEAGPVFERLGSIAYDKLVPTSSASDQDAALWISQYFGFLYESRDYKPFLKFFQQSLTKVGIFGWRGIPSKHKWYQEIGQPLLYDAQYVCGLFCGNGVFHVFLDMLEYEHSIIGSDDVRYSRYLVVDVNRLSSSHISHLANVLDKNLISLKKLRLRINHEHNGEFEDLRNALAKTKAVQELWLDTPIGVESSLVLDVNRGGFIPNHKDNHAEVQNDARKWIQAAKCNSHIRMLSYQQHIGKFTPGQSTEIKKVGTMNVCKESGPKQLQLYIDGFHSSHLDTLADFIKECQTKSFTCCVRFQDSFDCSSTSYISLREALSEPSQCLTSLTMGFVEVDSRDWKDAHKFSTPEFVNKIAAPHTEMVKGAMAVLSANTTLSELALLVDMSCIPDICSLIQTNKHLESLMFYFPYNIIISSAMYMDLSTLPAALSKNSTLQRFAIGRSPRREVDGYTSFDDEKDFQEFVGTDFLYPVYRLMESGSTNLKSVAWFFPGIHDVQNDHILSKLSEVRPDMLSYRKAKYPAELDFLGENSQLKVLRHEISITL